MNEVEKATCSRASCDRPVYAREWCAKHYFQWYNAGGHEEIEQARIGPSPVLAEEAGDQPDALVPVLDAPIVFTAQSPAEMAGASRGLSEWFSRKIRQCTQELKEAKQNLETARRAKWGARSWQTLIARIGHQRAFYQKVLVAVDAGYVLMPDLPLESFAIRTAHEWPAELRSKQSWASHRQPAETLPVGEGQYVSPIPKQGQEKVRTWDDAKKQDVIETEYFADEFRDVAFPVLAVRPRILHATAAAMALHVFDEIGLVEQAAGATKKDPMVAGRIRRPKGGGVTCFIAWWLDPEQL